jgi:probable HAF family extracellular repeat protein
MTSRTLMCITATTLFAALAITVRLRLAAQEQPAAQQALSAQAGQVQQVRYKLVDLGTLGGPSAYGPGNGPGSQLLNNAGIVVGTSDTLSPDPNAPDCANPDCFVSHGFRWQDGVLTDLGVLSGVNWSHANSINAGGWIAGTSTTGEIDPFNPCGFQPLCPQFHAVLWMHGEITDIGTLGQGLGSDASYVNDAGQVVGSSTINTTPDPFSFLGAQTHAFMWQNGVMRDLGTLGGTDSGASFGCNNQRSDLVAGGSFTNSTLNPTTGFPTQHAFLWGNGTMQDIPTLGGIFAFAQCANNLGQVIGQSNLAGDVDQHAFFWDGGTLTDLGTLGGSFSTAIWLNDQGDAVGGATTTDDQSFHATLWRNGLITDLGTLPGDCFSIAWAVNSKGQIAGESISCDFSIQRAVLWERGLIFDLSAAISEPSNINDRGEIAGEGLPAGCDNGDRCGHEFLLIPCDEAGTEGCEEKAGSNPAARSTSTTTIRDLQKTKEFVARWRARLAQRNHIPGLRTPRD